MATPAATPPGSITFNCTNVDELFISFVKLTDGSPLPSNVIDCVNPYGFDPKYLPEDVWFLISSKEEINMEHGVWKIKEEAREVFSNSDILGWKTTLAFYNGQVPHQHKTDYVMEVFNITMKRLDDDNEKKETSSLCRVYLVPTNEVVDNGTRIHLTPHTDLDSNSSSSRIASSTRTPEVNKHDDNEALAVTERFPFQDHQGEDLFEMDLSSRGSIDFFAGGNFLELKDLDNNPGSPSSSSDNSSAMSVSSEECFDTLAFLQELDEPVLEQRDSGKKLDFYAGGNFLELKDLDNNPGSPSSSSDNSSAMSVSSDECFDTLAFLQELDEPVLEQRNSGKKLDVIAANKPDEYVLLPATLESLVSVEGSDSSNDESLKSTAGSAHMAKRAKLDRKDEGPSSSRKPSGSRKGGGMKKFRKKYLCFMPF